MSQPTASLNPKIDFAAVDRLFDLKGMRTFIPGGYGALGEAVARSFAHLGARVAIAGPNIAKAESLAAAIRQSGGDAVACQLDARKPDNIAQVTDAIAEQFGGIDTMINCVGIQKEQKLMQVTGDIFDEMYETNLRSAMFLAQATARHQIKAGNGGRHIHLLSVRAQLALRDRGYSAYCATKGGLLMLVKQHAMELAPHAITVNGVAPTFIQSERIRPHLEHDKFKDFILERNPLGRIGDPLEIVGQIIAFAAPSGSYMTGQVVYIDGGVTASQ